MLRSILKEGAAVIGVRVMGAILALCLTIVLTRYLGPAGFGGYAYALSLLIILSVPINYGWSVLLLRTISAANSDEDWNTAKALLRKGGVFALCLSFAYFCLAVFIFMVLGVSVPFETSLTILVILGFATFFEQLAGLRIATLRGLGRPVAAQVPELILRPSVLILCLFAIATFLEYEITLPLVMLILLVAIFASAIAGGILLVRHIPDALQNAVPSLVLGPSLKAALLLAANAGLIIVNTQVDLLLLGAFGTAADVGTYRVAVQMALLCGFVYTALNFIAVQRFAQTKGKSFDNQQIQSARIFARLAFLGALPLPIIIFFWGEPIFALLFGSDFVAPIQPFNILVLAQITSAFFGMTGAFLMSTGKETRFVRITLIGLATNILLGLFLIPPFGMIGAAISVTTSTTLWCLLLWGSILRIEQLDLSVMGIWTKNE